MYGKGAVIGGLNARRGTIIDSEVHEDEFTAVAEVALNDMFQTHSLDHTGKFCRSCHRTENSKLGTLSPPSTV